jgi:SP family general alpha glucoside:H+ symporter-like MFS transporter
MPKMVGKNDWNWGAKGGFFWSGIALLFMVLFEHKVSARKFTREAADALKPALTEVAMGYEKKGEVEQLETRA